VGLAPGIASVLRSCVAHTESDQATGAALRRFNGPELVGLAQGAGFHGVSAYLLAASEEGAGLPPDEREQLRSRRRAIAIDHLRAIGNLRFLHDVLGEAEVPWLVVKGPTLGEPVHGDPLLRGYADLDAVVPAPHLRGAITALTAAGAELLDRNWTLLHAEMKGEVHLALPSGTELDLHWHLLNDRERRASFPIRMDELFERARTVKVGGLDVPTLDAADTVVYVALHSVLSGADRLIWLKDVERLLARTVAPLDAIGDRARRWNAELALAAVLSRVDGTIGLPPGGAELLSALPRHRLWTAISGPVWRVYPVEREDGSGSLGRLAARSVRATQQSTLRAFAAKAGTFLMATLRGVQAGGHRSIAPDDPGSGAYASGGDVMREAYLDAVAQQG
jgi:hypothetical protein